MVIGAAILLPLTMNVNAQQLTNADFEDWSGEKFKDEIQPKGWNASNVEQLSFKFNFAHREAGRNGGYCMMVQDQDVGAAGITETSPGYFSLGKPWVYLQSVLAINEATAGTAGSINFKYRPDSMAVWIKRTGNNTDKEDFYLLYYSWKGTAVGEKYKNKQGGCTSVSKTDEESDVRLELNGNECGTPTKATQVAEGMWREKKTYANWTRMVVPIYYFNNEVPQKMNIIFSASNYPNFRANDGLYTGNSLYVDDVELIYSSKIQKLYVGGKEWKAFDQNNTGVQTYSLGETATSIPAITARRGIGSLTNARGKTVPFNGRELNSTEMTIDYGDLESRPTKITVKSEDGKSTTVYQIQFQRAPSTNATLAEVRINNELLADFRPAQTNYNVELPYGTKKAPEVTYTLAEDGQTAVVTQATSPTGTATIKVTAADKTTTKTYTFNFSVGELKDATLKDIKVNGKSIPGFTPSQAIYKVSLPVGTSDLTVEPVSAYDAGEQTIVIAPNPLPKGESINGSTIQITVTAGTNNPVTKTYKLNIKLEKSSYSYLADLQVIGDEISFVKPAKPDNDQAIAFAPDQTTYYINLKMGAKKLPQILWTPGDEFQTIKSESLPEGVVEGTVRITVTAGNESDQTVYKLVFSAEKSENSTLNGIEIDGKPIEGFRPDSTYYVYELPIEATTLPEVKPIPFDEFQEIKTYAPAGLVGKYRISVTAGNGATTNYYIDFKQLKYTDNTLKSLSVEGYSLQDADFQPVEFDPQRNEYWVKLASDATEVPEVSLELQNELYQDTVTRRPTSTNGDFKVTVRPRSGASRIYTIHFVCKKSDNTALKMIYLDGVSLKDFDPAILSYTQVLDTGATQMPDVTWDLAENTQTVTKVWDGRTIRITVQAQNGAKRTYKIKFVIPSSASTQVEMIYLNEVPLPGFRKDSVEYTYELPYGATCPKITVASSPGQQVTITAPYAAGIATIRVATEDGDSQDYTIEFVSVPAASVQLLGILINNETLAGFSPTKLNYESAYEGDLPVVQGIPSATVDTISVVWNDTVAWLHVKDVNGNKAAYSVTFTHNLSPVNTLLGIYEDKGAGEQLIDGFKPAQLNYSYSLAPGSSYPSLSYKVSGKAEVVFFGQLEEGKWGITIVAENGDEAVYTVEYTIEKYSDATLKDLAVEGQTFSFDPNTFNYEFTIDEGADLPQLTVDTREGQTVLVSNVNDTLQTVIICAENGATRTYNIKYTRTLSNNALLADIKINGVSLVGFDPNIYEYTDSLARGTKIVPNVFPIGQLSTQTITTYFSKPDGTTLIHVEAQSGATQDYKIYFPVDKSKTVALQSVLIMESDDFTFNPEVTDYFNITLPQGTTASPDLDYEKKEPVQNVEVIRASLNDTSKLIVTAENGDKRVYQFTYRVAASTLPNKLAQLKVNGDNLDLTSGNEFTVILPYATTTFDVTYVKAFPEQTVSVVNGGVYQPTTVTVYSNRHGEDSTVYVIKPQLMTYTPAVLTSLKLNDAPIHGFQPDQFAYIVNVINEPESTGYTAEDGITVEEVESDAKHVKYKVTKDEYTNYYTMYFYYANDLIPSNNFSEWDPTKYNSKQKPRGWMVPVDIAANYTWTWLETKVGNEVTALAGGGVSLTTTRDGGEANAIYGSIPGIVTTGQLNLKLASTGKSTSSVSDINTKAVTFRNTPEQVYVEYNCMAQQNMDNWRLWVELNDGSHTTRTTTTTEEGKFVDVGKNIWHSLTKNLDYKGLGSIIRKMNITLNSAHSDNARDLGGTPVRTSVVNFRNLKFLFNSKFASAQVDGQDAVVDNTNNTITFDIADPEYAKVPELSFVGQKPDQAPTVIMAPEVNGVRTIQVINYGEDSTYTTYTATITRPLSTEKRLNAIVVGGTVLSGFDKEKTTYNYTVANGTRFLPDVDVTPVGNHQTIEVEYVDNKAMIHVFAETGEENIYTINFVEAKSNSTELAMITATGVDFVADTREYHISGEVLPAITFTRLSDGQKVDLNKGQLTVTAEDGTVGYYNIICDFPATTGLIEYFYKGTNIITGFGETDFTHEEDKPTELITFDKKSERDSVVFVQTPAKMEWQVYGSTDHTYEWIYPTEQSANTNLAAILIDGVPYTGYIPGEYNYDLTSDTTVVLSFVAAEPTQQMETTISSIAGGVLYTTVVTAESGAQATYKVTVTRPLSNIATLAGILLDSIMVEGFDPMTNQYVVTLPAPKGAKLAQPKMPNVTYIVGQKGQKVTLQAGQLNGDQTVLTVESEDGNVMDYYLTIKAEPSHCSDLTGITVNGEAMDHFEPGRHYYSVSLKTDEVLIGYTSDDRFQTVQTIIGVVSEGRQYRDTLHVIAEDGSFSDYIIEIYIENQSNDAQLANILLDQMDFVTYGLKSGINPDIKPFDPGLNEYHINVIKDSIPLVSAQLKMDGQAVKIETFKDSVYLHVWAVDSTLNTYKLYFEYKKSTNTALKWITINEDSIIAPTAYFYTYDKLKMGEELPIVDAEPVSDMATVNVDRSKNPITITVIAEDNSYKAVYTISCDFKPSTVNTLEMIYENGKPLKDFDPLKFSYDTVLNAGESFPTIDYGELTPRDNTQWPYIDSVTVTFDSVEHIWVHQTTVKAQSNEMNVYTLSYTIRKWDVDTLESIEVENVPLAGFKGSEQEYYYSFTPNQVIELNGRAPIVKWFKGEDHQVVDSAYVEDSYKGKSLGFKHVLTVRAENNATRTYTIHYPVELSSDATLQMININEVPLKDFDPERNSYKVELDFGLPVPNVTAVTWNEDQIVKPYQVGDTVVIDVWAEDKTYNAYTIVFDRVKSTIATLDNIILTDKDEKQFPYERFYFSSETYDYVIEMPYDSTVTEFMVPDMKIVKSDPFQTVTVDTIRKADTDEIEIIVHVLAPNNEDEAEYRLTFHFARNNDAALKDIKLRGVSVKGFKSDKLDYPYAHPYGSDSTVFFKKEDVQIVKSDPLATDSIYVEENGTIVIVITAQDKKTQSSYSIQQYFGKDTVNTLQMIYLDGVELAGFDPEVTEYTYMLMNGAGATPFVTGIPTSVNADTTYLRKEVNDTTLIFCTAQDGSDRIYRILFKESDINDGITATSSKEVFIRRVAGANQLFVSTIRSGVFFYLYDQAGHLVYQYENLPTADPNNVEVERDGWDNDILLNVDPDPNSGIFVDIIPQQIYFYSFVSAKKKIAYGKLIAIPAK